MFDEIIQQLTQRLQGWTELSAFIDQDQVIMLILVLGIAWALQSSVRRLLDNLRQRLVDIPWIRNFLAVIEALSLPVTALILGQLGLEIFASAGMNTQLLAVANRLITLWIVYRLISALLQINLSAELAGFWTSRVLLPLIIFVGLLRIFGVMDQVLDWGFSLGQRELKITVGSLFFGLLTLIIFFMISRGIRQFLGQVFLPQAGAEPALSQAISTLVFYIIIIIGTGVALSAMGIDLTTFAVIAGGLSVGLGFGLQEIINNFVSGFILLFERSLGPGDVVRIGDDIGVVKGVGIRSTTIRTRDDIELIVPNSYFLTEIVTNLTRSERQVRVRISVGVSYSSNPREVEQALIAATADHPHVQPQPAPRVQFKDFGESSLNFDLLVWTDQTHRIPGFSSELRHKIWESLAERNIEIPFPQRDLHLRSGIPWTELLKNNQFGETTTPGQK